MHLKWLLPTCLVMAGAAEHSLEQAHSVLEKDDECHESSSDGSCAIEALQVKAEKSEVSEKCAAYKATEQFSCNADPDCKFCWDASMNQGTCKAASYSPDSSTKEYCDVVPTGCNKFADNETCNAEAACKFCESFIGSPALTYCIAADSKEGADVAECDEPKTATPQTTTPDGSDAVLGAGTSLSWYWSHGRWHHSHHHYHPPPPRYYSDRRRHQPPAQGSCAAYGCGGFNRAHACQCNDECARYNSCCGDYQAKCHQHAAPAAPQGGQVLTLFHQTSEEIGKLIMKTGFRPGHAGWCGGAIYFATSPRATETKAIGTDSHLGYMLTVKVRVGKVAHLNNRCQGHAQAVGGGYNTVEFNPGDGSEYVIWNKDQVISISGAPYENHQAVHKWNR